jgi:hypothetical protein
MSIKNDSSGNPDEQPDFGKLASIFGPGAVDQAIRQAIQTCWLMLPADKKNPDELEATVRRIFDRAIQNFREDSATLGNP